MIIGGSGLAIFAITFVMTMAASLGVKWAYAKYSKIGTRRGWTGAAVAQRMLAEEGITDVQIECIPGEMTDHYDPRTKVVRLSTDVYSGNSIAALGIAAHEVGHAIQHAQGYAPMHVRQVIYPVSSIGTNLGPYLVIAGLFISQLPWLMWAGIYLFGAGVAFTIITLPVEFDASRRALLALEHGMVLERDELTGARKVLGAAALTYVAAAAASIMMLMHYIMLAQSRRS